jgi:hypothetical protein
LEGELHGFLIHKPACKQKIQVVRKPAKQQRLSEDVGVYDQSDLSRYREKARVWLRLEVGLKYSCPAGFVLSMTELVATDILYDFPNKIGIGHVRGDRFEILHIVSTASSEAVRVHVVYWVEQRWVQVRECALKYLVVACGDIGSVVRYKFISGRFFVHNAASSE